MSFKELDIGDLKMPDGRSVLDAAHAELRRVFAGVSLSEAKTSGRVTLTITMSGARQAVAVGGSVKTTMPPLPSEAKAVFSKEGMPVVQAEEQLDITDFINREHNQDA